MNVDDSEPIGRNYGPSIESIICSNYMWLTSTQNIANLKMMRFAMPSVTKLIGVPS